MLGYLDFNRKSSLETDASLKGLDAILSQQDNTGKVHVIAYTSWALRPPEQSMHNYSLAKLELLTLKWVVIKKFRECLLGSKFTVYTDNNSLVHIQTSKLGASQICWLSKLSLFNFYILYRSGKINKAADALSQCPVDPQFVMESVSDNDSEDPFMFSYATICNTTKLVLEATKELCVIKKEVQAISHALEGEISMNAPELHEVPDLLYIPMLC